MAMTAFMSSYLIPQKGGSVFRQAQNLCEDIELQSWKEEVVITMERSDDSAGHFSDEVSEDV